MKRPLKPSEVPPGSVFRQDTTFKPGEYCVPSSVREHGIHLLTEFFSWEDLKNSLWRILRPGESWQPCCVEEFSKDDYKPGQEVEVETARKLHVAGVKLQCLYLGASSWVPVLRCFETSNQDLIGWKFRIPPAKAVRNLRPDELPERFEVLYPSGTQYVWSRCKTTKGDISNLIAQNCKWRTDLNAKELKPFTVEE